MKTSVLHFSGENPLEDRVFQALSRSGIRVKRVKSLSKLHLYAASGSVDAILVERAITERYRLGVMRHLWEARSSIAVITWTANALGAIDIAFHARPASLTGAKRAERNEIAGKMVRDALTAFYAGTDPIEAGPVTGRVGEPDGESRETAVTLPPFPEGISLHKKARALLEIVRESGDTGADTARIAELLWPGEGLMRKRDIQSYVARLRGALNRAFPRSYRIVRAQNRYILRQIGK